MTNRRIRAVAVAATAGGGLLTAAFLQTAVAVAAPGEDAFTIGGTTFDPITASGDQGFDLVGPLSLAPPLLGLGGGKDRKSTRLNSSHVAISYAVFCLKKRK